MFKNAIIKEEDIENMSEYELFEYKQRLVKEIFTENDFLNLHRDKRNFRKWIFVELSKKYGTIIE